MMYVVRRCVTVSFCHCHDWTRANNAGSVCLRMTNASLGRPTLARTEQAPVIGHNQQYWAVIGYRIILVFTDTPTENCLYRPER